MMEVERESTTSLDLVLARVQGPIASIESKLVESWHLLKASGSLFLICDWERAYDVKLLADRVFGSETHLRNEIVWVVRQSREARASVDQHATILWYVKDLLRAPFNELTMPRSRETVKRFGDGRIVSSISRRTGRRAPTRIEGASLAAPLNDVWVWDEAQAFWVHDLEQLDGRAPFHSAARTRSTPDRALRERLVELTGLHTVADAAVSDSMW